MSRLEARMSRLHPLRMAHLQAWDACNALCNELDWATDPAEIQTISRRLADARRVEGAYVDAMQYLLDKPLEEGKPL